MPRKKTKNGGPCSVDGCGRVSKKLLMCDMHYFRFVRTGSTEYVPRGEAISRGKKLARKRDPFVRTQEAKRAWRQQKMDEVRAAREARRPKLDNDPAVQLYRAEIAMRQLATDDAVLAAAMAFENWVSR